MATTGLWKAYALALGSDVISQIVGQAFSTGVEEIIEGGDGRAYNEFVAAGRISPTLRFTSTNLKAVLDAVSSMSGLRLTTGTVGTAFFQKVAPGGTRSGSGSHRKLVVNEGLVVPTRLTSDQRRSTIELMIHAIYDGANMPVVATDDQSLSGSPTFSQHHVAGPVAINGTDISGIRSINIDFGFRLFDEVQSDGEAYDTFAAIDRVQPSITIETTNLDVFDTVGHDGVAQGATDSTIYFRKAAAGGTRVADATAEHILATINAGRIRVEEATAEHDGAAVARIIITPIHDLSNDLIAWTTATAIGGED